MALNSLYCADVPLSNYSLTHSLSGGCRRPHLQPECCELVADWHELVKNLVKKWVFNQVFDWIDFSGKWALWRRIYDHITQLEVEAYYC